MVHAIALSVRRMSVQYSPPKHPDLSVGFAKVKLANARRAWPLALMVSANQVTFRNTDNMMSLTFDGVFRRTG